MSQGYQWSAWAFAAASAADIDATPINDAASLISDEISFTGKAAAEIAVTTAEDDTGATDGDIEVYVLRYGATGWQAIADASQVLSYAQTRNTTHEKAFPVDPGTTGSIKVLVFNDCGQQVAASVKYRTATFGTA